MEDIIYYIENVHIIDFDTFIKTFINNIKITIDLIKNKNDNSVIIIIPEEYFKSNFWMTLIFFNHIKTHNEDIFKKIKNIIINPFNLEQKNDITYLFFDDVSYSGTQITQNIVNYNNVIVCLGYANINTIKQKLYEETIETITIKNEGLINTLGVVNNNYIFISKNIDFLEITNKEYYKEYKTILNMMGMNDTSLTIFQHKIADNLSLATGILFNTPMLNIYKLFSEICNVLKNYTDINSLNYRFDENNTIHTIMSNIINYQDFIAYDGIIKCEKKMRELINHSKKNTKTYTSTEEYCSIKYYKLLNLTYNLNGGNQINNKKIQLIKKYQNLKINNII